MILTKALLPKSVTPMRTDSSVTVHRSDYTPYSFQITSVNLDFDLQADKTRVKTKLIVSRRTELAFQPDLVLDGEDLTLVAITLNGEPLAPSRLLITTDTLTVKDVPDHFALEITSFCHPARNSSLMGLYVSGGNFFTQCEAQGFRRICWFADRPDVLSIFSVTLKADKTQYPVMLSNGNLIKTRDLEANMHEAVWHDPFAKPAYLFALVAGNFACREQTITTQSGRDALLQIYSDPGTEKQTVWAMECLVRSLRWDEQRFGLELDLDRFMIVAARDFNMGAMENKGLNIFNAAYVLADPDTATDANYQAIEAVIGHEYFHNWTGNRVTCRDWFQLSLKEGLTVFRDQEFTADMMAQNLNLAEAKSARTIKRIDDVITLRNAQFPEDSGPMAHPIRPESYQEIGNFYTTTVYEKGAEVIRMLHTLLGEKLFQAGMAEYFRRHDGQAVTCDDFVNAMEFAYQQQDPQNSLEVFRRWYRQAGTPRVSVALNYDAAQEICSITLTQSCSPVGIEKQSAMIKAPFHIPVKLGLLDEKGNALLLRQVNNDGEKHKTQETETALLELTQDSQTWHFAGIKEKPLPSILRDFSAPVLIDYQYTNEELAVLSGKDPNAFTRWEAGQALALRQILASAQQWRTSGAFLPLDPTMLKVWRTLVTDKALDAGYLARALSLPAEKSIFEKMMPIDPLAVAGARRALRQQLGGGLTDLLQSIYSVHTNLHPYSPAAKPAGQRALKNLALSLLMACDHPGSAELAYHQFKQASNMTDRIAALTALANETAHGHLHDAMTEFYEMWQHESLVIDKWFAVQAMASASGVDTIRALMSHPAFTMRNPNRARSVIFSFCMHNTTGFHAVDGSGYAFWTEQVLALDQLNPEIAARLARALDPWSRFVPTAKALMQENLEKVAAHPGLSRNTLEIVTKALAL
jgi:aminopeptidase N